MSDEWMAKQNREQFKPQLQRYLMDKVRRRSDVTSDAAYQDQEAAYADDRDFQEQGGLLGALFTGASMAGTLGGKRSDDSTIPKFFASQKDAAQTEYANNAALRAQEERALGTDLNVAKYVSDLDQFDDTKKLNQQRLDLDREQGKDRTALLYNELYRGIEEKAAARLIDKQRADEYGRHNLAGEELIRNGHKGATAKPWREKMGTDADGNPVILQTDPYNGSEPRIVPLPKGFKPTGKPDPSPYAKERAPGAKLADTFDQDYAKKISIVNTQDRELQKLKELIDSGQEDAAAKHAEGMLKGLNAAFGSDAVGVEESNRLGGLLKPYRGPGSPGPWFGRQTQMFYDQAKAKADVIRQSAQDSRARALATRAGTVDTMDTPPAPSQPPAPRKDPKNTQQPWLGAEDPQIVDYASQHHLDYKTAKAILVKRGYEPHE